MHKVHTQLQKSIVFGLIFMAFISITPRAEAAIWSSSFEVSGWIPYWRVTTGVTEAVLHMQTFKELNPFGYSVKTDGSLKDTGEITKAPWTFLRTIAKKNNVRYIPTVMWSDGDAIHAVLSDPAQRTAHVKTIVQMVKENNFDGVDIDYEAKKAETRDAFSLFLKELYKAMGDKWVMCTIEARTPAEDRFKVIPEDLEYANDFKEINKYCDRVRIMAYDQDRIDLKLNDSNTDPYAPVADIRWVEKVMTLAMKDIDKRKLVLGIPTYGYAWDMFPGEGTKMQYSKLWAFNPRYATVTIGPAVGAVVQRSPSGEAYISYPASVEPDSTSPVYMQDATRLMFWNDAQAIAEKVALAKRLGIRGVALFKIDGGIDVNAWSILR